MQGQWSWLKGGIALGLTFLLAIALVKPIGVSTQFVIADGLIWSLFDRDLVTEESTATTGFSSHNAYLDKSGGKYAKSVANPVNYGFVFVLAMIAGGFLSSRLGGRNRESEIPDVWAQRFGDKPALRMGMSFAAGAVVVFGARLAGGCTSGHMMSGMMQTSLSGYMFALGAFAVAIPTAMLVFGRR
jgi:uncharacterized membrane protein YedE/YeeE